MSLTVYAGSAQYLAVNFFCTRCKPYTGYLSGIYIKRQAYFLWAVHAGAVSKGRKKTSVYDLLADRRNIFAVLSDQDTQRGG